MPKRLDQFQRGALLLTILLLSLGYAAVGLLFVLVAVIWEWVVTRNVPWRRGPLDLPFSAFAVALLLSGLLSVYKETALGAWVLAVLTIYLGYGLLYRLLMRDPKFLTPFLLTWVVGGVIAAAWACGRARLFGPPAGLPELWRTTLATVLVIPFVLGLRWLADGPRRAWILAALGLAVVASALLLTVARGAWLGAGVGVLCYLALLHWKQAWRILAFVVAIGATGALVAGTDLTHLSQRAKSIVSLSAPTNRSRLAVADSALAMFRDHPVVGIGLTTFSRYHPGYPSRFYPNLYLHFSAHNIFLNMATEGGLLGLASFSWLLLAVLGVAWQRYKSTPPEELPLVSAVFAAFIGLIVDQQFEASIVSVHLGTAFWFLIAAQVARTPQSAAADAFGQTPATVPGQRPSALIVSNGHGEDGVGMALARELIPHASVTAYPLVGSGGAYRDVPVLDPRRPMPSGGFAWRGSWRHIWGDARAGWAASWLAQRTTLRRQRGRHQIVVAIGDVYCLQMAALAAAPTVFIATAKSEYNEPHRWVERWLIRRQARVVFVRDRVTADALQTARLPAVYTGNPLMDTIGITGGPVSTHDTKPTVTLLPGSHADAYENLRPLLQLSETVAGSVAASFFCALAPGIDRTRLTAEATNAGWHTNGDVLQRAGTTVRITSAFGDAVQAADVVVGLAGTANEQAAGLGKPVVIFTGTGSQVTAEFVALQQRLLGEALVAAADWRDAARAVARLLGDPNERAARGEAGRRRMGLPGAVTRIAQAVLVQLGCCGSARRLNEVDR
jgi:uncharacterized protein (TIGR03492 family)